MTWVVHLTPPSVVVITAAPLGAPPPPTVEPMAQHREALAQSSEVRELTGAGRATALRAPSHGDPVPKVEGGGVDSEVAQPVTDSTMKTVAAIGPSRRGEMAITDRRGEFSEL